MNLLDLHVIRAALHDARREMEQGHSPEAAVALACRGAWRPYRQAVYVALINCVALPSPTDPLLYPLSARALHRVDGLRHQTDLP